MLGRVVGSETTGVVTGDDGILRCWWGGDDPLYRRYHDLEWGRPVAHDRRLFEKISLEGFQSGLSWLTILRKRDNFREAFKSFEIQAVAQFKAPTVERLLADPGIVRNRAKIEAVIHNARRCLALIDEFGSLAAYVWSFEPDERSRPRTLDRSTLLQITAPESAKTMSNDLKRRGWSFVGPTTIYSFMQAVGIVNDHLTQCYFRDEVERARSSFSRPSPPPPVSVPTPGAPVSGDDRSSARPRSDGRQERAPRRGSHSRDPSTR